MTVAVFVSSLQEASETFVKQHIEREITSP
jgi:hypothetical protein